MSHVFGQPLNWPKPRQLRANSWRGKFACQEPTAINRRKCKKIHLKSATLPFSSSLITTGAIMGPNTFCNCISISLKSECHPEWCRYLRDIRWVRWARRPGSTKPFLIMLPRSGTSLAPFGKMGDTNGRCTWLARHNLKKSGSKFQK